MAVVPGEGATIMADEKGTQTQPRPNISTENHMPGDAPPTKT